MKVDTLIHTICDVINKKDLYKEIFVDLPAFILYECILLCILMYAFRLYQKQSHRNPNFNFLLGHASTPGVEYNIIKHIPGCLQRVVLGGQTAIKLFKM